MAEYLSDLLQALDAERNARRRQELRNECANLVLQIWALRAELQHDFFPLRRLSDVLEALADLKKPMHWAQKDYKNKWLNSLEAVNSVTKTLRVGLIRLAIDDAALQFAKKQAGERAGILSNEELRTIEKLNAFVENWQFFSGISRIAVSAEPEPKKQPTAETQVRALVKGLEAELGSVLGTIRELNNLSAADKKKLVANRHASNGLRLPAKRKSTPIRRKSKKP